MATVDDKITELRSAIAGLEAQRALLGDALVEVALAPMREKLAALEAAQQPAQQRKQASVLFADVYGFTALSETLDAEVVVEVMNDLWAEVDKVILDHGGRIDKHIGDAVMALWGADGAREDDPEMSVRAALELQAAVDRFCSSHSVPLSLRIGVNTGPVVLGTVATTSEFTAMGDAVNLASRLEHAAPVGGVLISHDTYRHVRGIFDVLEQEPLAVKGKTEPVQTYVVQRAKPRAFRMATRGVEGVETRMVGRDRELELLQDAYTGTRSERKTQVLTIAGEAGVGKSRLLYEFDKWLDLRPEQIYYFKGRATPHLQSVPYSLFRDLFAYRFGILDSDPAAKALEKFRDGMVDILEPEKADVTGHWLGFDFGSSEAVQRLLGGAFGAAARAHLVRYFRTLAAAEPVVVFLEDIHWADDPSLDLVAYLPEAIPEAQLLFIAAARPSLSERRPRWGEGKTAFKNISMTPLSKPTSEALVDEILQRVDEVPDRLRDLITDAAGGNPFYVEEMVKMLIDQGVIIRGGGAERQGSNAEHRELAARRSPFVTERWTVRADRLQRLKVPSTLIGLLQARLDGLPRAEREALQRAAVIGRRFWDDVVADLGQGPVEDLKPILQSMVEREIIFRQELSTFASAEEYVFKHALLRDVAYETVLLKNRAELHARAARWLESRVGERRDENLGRVAEHYALAGENLKAAALLERAGREDLAVGSLLAARQAFERALELRGPTSEAANEATVRTQVDLGRVQWLLADFTASEQMLEQALVGARRAGDTPVEGETLAWLAILFADQGQFERAGALAEAALIAARSKPDHSHPWVLRSAATVAWLRGELDAADALATEALESGRRMGESEAAALALSTLGNIAASRRDLERANAIFTEVRKEAHASGNVSREAIALANLGNNAYLTGDYDLARTYARAALERQRELGEVTNVIVALGNLAQAELKLGEVSAARQGIREALRLALSLKADNYIIWVIFIQGQLLAAEGRVSQAMALFGLVRNHHRVDYDLVHEIDDELDHLNLLPEQIKAGLAAGASLDFETVVQDILDGKW